MIETFSVISEQYPTLLHSTTALLDSSQLQQPTFFVGGFFYMDVLGFFFFFLSFVSLWGLLLKFYGDFYSNQYFMSICLFTWLCNKWDNIHSAPSGLTVYYNTLEVQKVFYRNKSKAEHKTLVYAVLTETKQITYWKLVVISPFPVSIAAPSSKDTNNQDKAIREKFTTISHGRSSTELYKNISSILDIVSQQYVWN